MTYESCHTHDIWVMSHTWHMSHVTHMTYESCHTHDIWVMSHTCHDYGIWVMSHIYRYDSCEWVMSRAWVMSYLWIMWHIRVTRMSHLTHMSHVSRHTGVLHMCHNFMCDSWLFAHINHVIYIWHIWMMPDIPQTVEFVQMQERERVTPHIWATWLNRAHMNESCHT